MKDNRSDNFDFQNETHHRSNIHQSSKPTTLIMKGGGIKGLAYVGSLEVLSVNNYRFNWFAGTSAGAISAALMGCGYSHKELELELSQKNFNEFKDTNLFGCIWNLITKGGLYQANTFTKWLDHLLAKKLDTPNRVLFNTLKEKKVTNRITIYASRRGTKVQVFDSKVLKDLSDSESPPIAFAVRSSMAIPFFFTPTIINGYNTVDGGTQNNYPVNALLADNPGTKFVGLYLGPEIFEGEPPKKNVFSNLVSILTEANDEDALRVYEDDTIIIDTRPISTLDFSLTPEEKDFLLEAGRLSALKFLVKKQEIELPSDFSKRKAAHEVVRNKIKRKRKSKKRKRLLKKLLFFVVIIFAWIYSAPIRCWVSNFFPNYRTSIATSIGFTETFLLKQDASVKYSAWDYVNEAALSVDSIPNLFSKNEELLSSRIKYICLSNDDIRIVFHFFDQDTVYSGFKFNIANLKLAPLSDDEQIWYSYNSYDDKISNPNEFILRKPNNAGDYEFKAKIIDK